MQARIVLFVLISQVLFADQVTMKNGDRLSGSVVSFDSKNLVVKSEFTGQVSIPWDAVTGISSTEPLNVGLKDGEVLVGTVTTADAGLRVATKEAGTVTTAKDAVVFIRSKDEQAAYDADVNHLRNPRLIDLWTGLLDLGYAATRGNTDTSVFTLSANAARATTRDKTEAHFTMINSSSNASGKSLTTANAKRGGVGYSLNVTDRWFGFGAVEMENDEFQHLDLRFNPAGGLGYHAIKNEKAVLDLQAGASDDKEIFSTGVNRNFVEVLTAEDFNYKVSAATSIHQRLAFFPNLTAAGNYRTNFDISAVTAIRKWFSWQFTVSDRFLSNPLPGLKENDILLTTGLRLTFAK